MKGVSGEGGSWRGRVSGRAGSRCGRFLFLGRAVPGEGGAPCEGVFLARAVPSGGVFLLRAVPGEDAFFGKGVFLARAVPCEGAFLVRAVPSES